jgi:hypothetical protein
MLINHHIFIASFSPVVGVYYFRHLLFHGLWPLAPWDTSKNACQSLSKWMIKAFYLSWFIGVGLALVGRGIVGRPLREVIWGGYGHADEPDIEDFK